MQQRQSWPLLPRHLHTSAPALAVEEVLVPSMGDSITEGTIVNVSKAAGDAVAEDEVIAQIETDKVTIDVRAPHAGTLSEILVKDDDNVEVGQVVAKLDSKSSSSARTAEQAQPEQPKQEAAATPAPKVGGTPAQQARPQPGGHTDEAATAEPSKPHKARLAFPPRRTADGTRISSLPVAEAQQALDQLGHSSGQQQDQQQQQGAAPQQAGGREETTRAEAASEMEGVRLRRWAVGGALPLDEDWMPAPGKWALSDREMEMIDLGGADP